MAGKTYVCAVPQCPVIGPTRLCELHTRERNARQGSRQSRGYGAGHDRLRRVWAPRVAAGYVVCWRCGVLIAPGTPWDLGHSSDRTGYNGPEHTSCSRSAPRRGE